MRISLKDDKANRFLNIISDWKRLIQSDVLGFYQRCEVTEIVGFREGNELPFNILSVLVFEENEPVKEKRFLNKKPIVLSGYHFGLYQYHVKVQAIKDAVDQYIEKNIWSPSGNPLSVGNLYPVPIFFVPPDGTESTPLNSILKNNFWNGSHILELFDNKKTLLAEFLENPPVLQALSEKIQEYIPIGFSKLSDRLGNILIQLPVTAVMCEFFFKKDYSVAAKVARHPRSDAGIEKLFSLTTQNIHDGLVISYGSGFAKEKVISFENVDAGYNMTRSFLWDQKNFCLVAATNLLAPIRAIGGTVSCVVSGSIEPTRIIMISDRKKKRIVEEKIFISHLNLATPTFFGGVDEFSHLNFVHKRIYNNERKKIEENCEFVQYGVSTKNKHSDAVKDLRYLLNQHGQEGAWLWDPYLDYYDIMETLFCCKYARSDLRALNDYGRVYNNKINNGKNDKGFNQWRQVQQENFNTTGNNYFELRFEFRSHREYKGFEFHDRFLIFPKKGQAAYAWSLGTSVNSMGASHHILQKVDNGELIKEAFLDLWNDLNTEDHVVWRCG